MTTIVNQIWEYKCVDIPLGQSDLEKRLNELGKDKWELIEIHKNGLYTECIFKRVVGITKGGNRITRFAR